MFYEQSHDYEAAKDERDPSSIEVLYRIKKNLFNIAGGDSYISFDKPQTEEFVLCHVCNICFCVS